MPNALVPFTVTPAMTESAARHMRLASGFSDDQSAEIVDAFSAAVAHLESRLALCLIPRNLVWEGCLGHDGRADIPVGPLRSVVGAVRVDPLPEAALAVDVFGVDALSLRGEVKALHRVSGKVRMTVSAGFGDDWESTPADLRRAVMLLTAHYFDNRHAAADRASAIPHGVDALIQPWRPLRLSLSGAK